MGFGRNPYVPKPRWPTEGARRLRRGRPRPSLPPGPHEWDRAAEREKPVKARIEYEANAKRTRELAENPADLRRSRRTSRPPMIDRRR